MRQAVWLILTLGMVVAQGAGAADYPYPVERFTFESQRQDLSMAYMDVAPEGDDTRGVVVLLHG
ncbi:MAG: alpha/beta hydrolase, partial [Anaerolineae bacterium]|nr:alpha/beta hydrolase [Anaerolineae bacterium]